ncbi:MAG: CoA-binding protein [archaeon]
MDIKKSYAIVGASSNPEKYGYKVTLSLKELGFVVIPINPKDGTILDLKAYSTLGDAIKAKKIIDCIVFVVPPAVTENVLVEAKNLGIKEVWMQPGSESDASIKFCEQNGIKCTHHACIMKFYGNVK